MKRKDEMWVSSKNNMGPWNVGVRASLFPQRVGLFQEVIQRIGPFRGEGLIRDW